MNACDVVAVHVGLVSFFLHLVCGLRCYLLSLADE